MKSGWLSPVGEYYECDEYNHKEIAQKLGYAESTLERTGWIKVFDYGNTYYGRPNQIQYDFLENHGIQ